MIRNHSEEEVRRAIQIFRTFPVDIEVGVTDKSELKARLKLFGAIMGKAFSCLGGLRDIRIRSGNSTCPYPQWDPTVDHKSSVTPEVSNPDSAITVMYRSGVNDDVSVMDSQFGVLMTETREASTKATPGLHLLCSNDGYFRPGSNDSAVIARLRGGQTVDLDNAIENFKETAAQAFGDAAMNKCQLAAIMDPGGLTIMLLENTCVDSGQEDGRIQVECRAAYCHHQEDGTFWFEILCAVVNRLLTELPGLEGVVRQHGDAIRNGSGELFQQGRYRSLTRNNLVHQLAHSLYTDYARNYNANVYQWTDEALEPFGTSSRRDRRFDEFEVCKVLRQSSNASPAWVYKVVHGSINQGDPLVLKLFPPEKGEEVFLNEAEVYEYLNTAPGCAEKLWPEVFEFGSLSLTSGEVMYYLLLEYIDGEPPSIDECRSCAWQLWELGVDRGDAKVSHFVKTPEQKVVTFDFGFSEFAE